MSPVRIGCAQEVRDKIVVMIERYLPGYPDFEVDCQDYTPYYQVTLEDHVVSSNGNNYYLALDLEIGKNFEYLKFGNEFLSLSDIKKLMNFIDSMPINETRLLSRNSQGFYLDGKQNTSVQITGQKSDRNYSTLDFKLSGNSISVSEIYEQPFMTSDISNLHLDWKNGLVFGSTTSIEANEQIRLQETIINLLRQLMILLEQRNR